MSDAFGRLLAGSSLSTHADSVPDLGPSKWSPQDIERKKKMLERARRAFIATASEFERAMVCDTSSIRDDIHQELYIEDIRGPRMEANLMPTALTRRHVLVSAASVAVVAAMPAGAAIAAVAEAPAKMVDMFPAKDWTWLSHHELLKLLDEPLWARAHDLIGPDDYNLEDLDDDGRRIR